MRCPQCATLDDRVVDSRSTDDGTAIRRRRECLGCGRRFTTYERLEELPFVVVKRSGQRQPFDRDKVTAGIRAAAKNRPFELEQMRALSGEIEEALRLEHQEVTSAQIGLAVLERLRVIDEVTYLRFASVYKGFSDPDDFRREVGLLAGELRPGDTVLTKETEPKHHRPGPERAAPPVERN
jgi:transcriptional repressor NrdR